MRRKHTEGKWEFFKGAQIVGVNDSVAPEACDGFRTVCEVRFGDYEHENYIEHLANAQLITNAPQMLDMLIKIYTAQRDIHTKPCDMNLLILQDAKQIIDQATKY